MASRRKLLCSNCMKLFTTNSKKRFKCYVCLPKATHSKRNDDASMIVKTSEGRFICQRHGILPFDESGDVKVISKSSRS